MFQLYLIIMRLDMNNHVIHKHDQLWAEAYEIKPRRTAWHQSDSKNHQLWFLSVLPVNSKFSKFWNFLKRLKIDIAENGFEWALFSQKSQKFCQILNFRPNSTKFKIT